MQETKLAEEEQRELPARGLREPVAVPSHANTRAPAESAPTQEQHRDARSPAQEEQRSEANPESALARPLAGLVGAQAAGSSLDVPDELKKVVDVTIVDVRNASYQKSMRQHTSGELLVSVVMLPIYLREMENCTGKPAVPDDPTMYGPPLLPELVRGGREKELKTMLDFCVFERRMAQERLERSRRGAVLVRDHADSYWRCDSWGGRNLRKMIKVG